MSLQARVAGRWLDRLDQGLPQCSPTRGPGEGGGLCGDTSSWVSAGCDVFRNGTGRELFDFAACQCGLKRPFRSSFCRGNPSSARSLCGRARVSKRGYCLCQSLRLMGYRRGRASQFTELKKNLANAACTWEAKLLTPPKQGRLWGEKPGAAQAPSCAQVPGPARPCCLLPEAPASPWKQGQLRLCFTSSAPGIRKLLLKRPR